MKLYKRFAAGALAAVMAVSILTGCGSGGTAGAPGSGSGEKPSTGEGTGTEPGGGDQTGEGKDDPSIVAKSRTERFFNQNATMGKKYHSKVEWRKNNTLVQTTEVASDGVRYREIGWSQEEGDENHLIDGEEKVGYGINKKEKMMMRTVYTTEIKPRDLLEALRPYNFLVEKDGFKTGSRQVEGVLYYTEYFEDIFGKTITYCFDKNDTAGEHLRYGIVEEQDGTEQVIKVLLYNEPEFDAELLRVPEGYEVISEDKEGNLISLGTTPKDNYPN